MPSNSSSLPIGKLHQNGVAIQLFLDLLHHAQRIGAGAVHLVDERQPRHMVALHLAVDGHRLALHAADGAEHEDGAVQHAQAAFHFDGEIDVARRIDQIDLVIDPWRIVPMHGGGGAGDGNSAFALQIHVVHGRAPFALHFLNAVNAAGVEQNALAERGFARVDVGRNADVSQILQFHKDNLNQHSSTRGKSSAYDSLNLGVQNRGQQKRSTLSWNGNRRGPIARRVAETAIGQTKAGFAKPQTATISAAAWYRGGTT